MGSKKNVKISHKERENGGRYIAHVEGEELTGHLDWEFTKYESIKAATHTIVPPEIGGRGIAKLLVQRLVEDSREQKYRVIAHCWYVAKMRDENPEWADVLA